MVPAVPWTVRQAMRRFRRMATHELQPRSWLLLLLLLHVHQVCGSGAGGAGLRAKKAAPAESKRSQLHHLAKAGDKAQLLHELGKLRAAGGGGGGRGGSGAEVNARDESGATPLHVAAVKGAPAGLSSVAA